MDPFDCGRHSKIGKVHEREKPHNVRLVGEKKTNCLRSLCVGCIFCATDLFSSIEYPRVILETVLVVRQDPSRPTENEIRSRPYRRNIHWFSEIRMRRHGTPFVEFFPFPVF